MLYYEPEEEEWRSEHPTTDEIDYADDARVEDMFTCPKCGQMVDPPNENYPRWDMCEECQSSDIWWCDQCDDVGGIKGVELGHLVTIDGEDKIVCNYCHAKLKGETSDKTEV